MPDSFEQYITSEEAYRAGEAAYLREGRAFRPVVEAPARYRCHHCGQSHNGTPAYTQNGTYHYCLPCADGIFPACRICTVRSSIYNMVRRRGSQCYCNGCHQVAIGNEFRGVSKQFSPDNSFGSDRYFGIELETNQGKCSRDFAFTAKADGSINGWEYVSHKLRGNDGLREIRDFMDSAQHLEVGDNCGFHVHMDVSGCNSRQLFIAAMAFVVTEDFWFERVRDNRQNNNYCYRWQNGIFNDLFENSRMGAHFGDFANYQDRYAWFNLSAFGRHGTLENRLHHATWEFTEVRDWVILNLRFLEAALRMELLTGETRTSFTQRAMAALGWAQGTQPLMVYLAAQQQSHLQAA